MKKITFIDIDGVLCDFVGGVHKAFGLSYDYNKYPYSLGEWFWYEEAGLTEEEVNKVCTADFWENLEWMHDGENSLYLIENTRRGDEIYLLSCPMKNPESTTGKIKWINKHMPKYSNSFIITPVNKGILAGPDRTLFDDRDKNVDDFIKNGGEAVLVGRPWNSGYKLKETA